MGTESDAGVESETACQSLFENATDAGAILLPLPLAREVGDAKRLRVRALRRGPGQPSPGRPADVRPLPPGGRGNARALPCISRTSALDSGWLRHEHLFIDR